VQVHDFRAGVRAWIDAEHPFHRYLARALLLDSVLGLTAELRRAIGQQLVSAGTIPRLVEL